MAAPILLTVSAAEAGQKLVQYLGRVLGRDVPGSVFMRWIRTGQVRVDGKRAKPFDRLAQGQCVRLPPFAAQAAGQPPALDDPLDALAHAGPPPGTDRARQAAEAIRSRQAHPAPAPMPNPLDLTILAHTDDHLVLAKPAGLPVHPGSGWTDSVQTRLDKAFAGQPFVPAIAHRLDRDTSGVLLAARTHQALTAAHQAFKEHRAVKLYLCWVLGRWNLSAPGEPVELADQLEKSGPAGQQRVHAGSGREALLRATPLAVQPDRTLLLVRLFTGRTHQIRVQLASRGHPLAGDAKYGGGHGPLRLHAWRLTLDGQTWECPPDWEGQWDVTALLTERDG